jgi:predicted ATPase with chaperone activity
MSGFSARARDKILRVDRTMADLDGSEHMTAIHLSEATGESVELRPGFDN